MTPPPAPHLPLNERLRAVAARLSPVVFGGSVAFQVEAAGHGPVAGCVHGLVGRCLSLAQSR